MDEIEFMCKDCEEGFKVNADVPVFKYFEGYGMVAMVKCPFCTNLLQTNIEGPWDTQ